MNQTIRKRIEEINNGIVPEGYKKTHCGIFPCDWETKNLSYCVDIIDGDRGKEYPKETDFSDSGYCLFLNAGNVTVNGFCFKDNQFITEEKCNKLKKGKLDINDIVVTTRGTVGNFALFTQKTPYCNIRINSGMAIIKTKRNIDLNYLFCSLKSYITKKQIKKICFGSAQHQLTIPSISGMQVAFSQDKIEQSKIAEILMKWDEMVELQEQYIQKLELRKKAVMKKLLTPKDGWENKKMGDVCDIKTGNKNTQDSIFSGEYPFFVRSSKVERINTYSFDGEAILIPGDGNIGQIFHYVNGKFDYHQRVYKISDSKNISLLYIFYYLQQHLRQRVISLSAKATVDSLRLEMLTGMDIYYNENTVDKTVEVLEKADEEITLQKEKLEKIKLQRKAMQQYLLTGIVRVV